MNSKELKKTWHALQVGKRRKHTVSNYKNLRLDPGPVGFLIGSYKANPAKTRVNNTRELIASSFKQIFNSAPDTTP